jgi:hypothetical protein
MCTVKTSLKSMAVTKMNNAPANFTHHAILNSTNFNYNNNNQNDHFGDGGGGVDSIKYVCTLEITFVW